MQKRHFLAIGLLALAGCRKGQTMLGNNDFALLPVGSAPTYTGYGTGSAGGSEFGVNLNGANNYAIEKMTFRNIAGVAVNVQGGAGGWQHVGYLSKIAVNNSFQGFKFSGYAEYETVTDCNASNCVFGFLVESGNNSFSNCKATYCSIGVKIFGGPNNGHGVWNGLISNHCTYNLVCQGVSLGEHFVGCCFIGGQGGADQGVIQIVNSQGITLTGGQVAYVDVNIDATSQVEFVGVTLRGPVNFIVAAGGVLVAKNNLVVPGAAITLNGVAFSGNN